MRGRWIGFAFAAFLAVWPLCASAAVEIDFYSHDFGKEFPQQLFGDELYEIYFRFLETEDEYFDYAPAKVPPQGRWRIYGLGLPESILKKVYWENAARMLSLKV